MQALQTWGEAPTNPLALPQPGMTADLNASAQVDSEHVKGEDYTTKSLIDGLSGADVVHLCQSRILWRDWDISRWSLAYSGCISVRAA